MGKPLFENICDEQIFSQLYRKWATDLHNFVYYKYGPQVNPEDKVQEAFITLWNKCRETSVEKARSFLFTIVNNLTLNEIKHQKVVLKYQERRPREYTNENPEFLLEENEYLQKYQKALAKLPRRTANRFSPKSRRRETPQGNCRDLRHLPKGSRKAYLQGFR